METKKLTCTYSVFNYNEKRYSKPWIAVVTSWDVGKYPTLEFGASSANHSEAELDECGIGKSGQKDYRKPKNKDNNFFVATEKVENNTLYISETQAKEIFRSETLEKKLAIIDQILATKNEVKTEQVLQ